MGQCFWPIATYRFNKTSCFCLIYTFHRSIFIIYNQLLPRQSILVLSLIYIQFNIMCKHNCQDTNFHRFSCQSIICHYFFSDTERLYKGNGKIIEQYYSQISFQRYPSCLSLHQPRVPKPCICRH